jgi:hypothetical protein
MDAKFLKLHHQTVKILQKRKKECVFSYDFYIVPGSINLKEIIKPVTIIP